MSYTTHNDKVESQMRVFDVPEKSRPLTEHEKGQIAIRKNMERLRAERLAREAEKADKN